MHYVYIRARFEKHNAGKVLATKPRISLKLVYYEAYLDEWDARERELFFKSGWGRKYIQEKLARTLIKAKI